MRFNNFELKAPSSYGPIPVGNYDAQVSSCEWKENSQHTGEIIAVKYTIIGPTHNNRIVFSNFNIRNSSAKAEEIGQQQFSDFTRACGFDVMPDDTDMYLGKALNIRIGIEDADRVEPGKEPRNVVIGFRRSDAKPQPQEQSKPAGAVVPPWMQRKN